MYVVCNSKMYNGMGNVNNNKYYIINNKWWEYPYKKRNK